MPAWRRRWSMSISSGRCPGRVRTRRSGGSLRWAGRPNKKGVRWAHSVGEIISGNWEKVQKDGRFSTFHKRHLGHLRLCRTAALGGHVDGCTDCGHYRVSYNSCRNRHCPTCQGVKREEWILRREETLAQRTVFPCGLYLAAGVERALSVAPKTALQPAFQMLRRNGESFFKRPEIPGCEVRHDGGPAHMGAEHGPAPAPALHRPGPGGVDEGGQVENDAFGREIPLFPAMPCAWSSRADLCRG